MIKKTIREEITKKRRELAPELHFSMSASACQRLLESSFWQNSTKLALYVPIRSELDTKLLFEFAKKENKTILLPRCEGKEMHFHRVDDTDTLKKGSFGIPEPDLNHPLEDDLSDALVIAPCVAVSKRKARLGWGGGFYDRYFSKFKPKAIVAAVFDFQVVDCDFAESWDLVLDAVFTPTKTF